VVTITPPVLFDIDAPPSARLIEAVASPVCCCPVEGDRVGAVLRNRTGLNSAVVPATVTVKAPVSFGRRCRRGYRADVKPARWPVLVRPKLPALTSAAAVL